MPNQTRLGQMETMVNAADKGRRNEKKAMDVLEAEGWHIAFRSIRVRHQRIDFDNVFDIAALKGKFRKWVQVKSESSVRWRHDKEILRKWKNDYGNEYDSCEVWAYYDRKGFRKEIVTV